MTLTLVADGEHRVRQQAAASRSQLNDAGRASSGASRDRDCRREGWRLFSCPPLTHGRRV